MLEYGDWYWPRNSANAIQRNGEVYSQQRAVSVASKRTMDVVDAWRSHGLRVRVTSIWARPDLLTDFDMASLHGISLISMRPGVTLNLMGKKVGPVSDGDWERAITQIEQSPADHIMVAWLRQYGLRGDGV